MLSILAIQRDSSIFLHHCIIVVSILIFQRRCWLLATTLIGDKNGLHFRLTHQTEKPLCCAVGIPFAQMTNRAELLSRIDKLLAPMVVTQLKDCCAELRVSTTGRKDEMRARVRARLEVSLRSRVVRLL